MSFEGPNKIGGFIQFRRVRSFVIWSFHFAGVTVHKEFKLYGAMAFIRKFSWRQMHPYNLYTIRPTHNWRFSIWHVDTGTGNNPASAYWCWSGETLSHRYLKSFFLWLKPTNKYWKHNWGVHPRRTLLIDQISCQELLLFRFPVVLLVAQCWVCEKSTSDLVYIPWLPCARHRKFNYVCIASE